uniref:Sorting and assembly machinery component 50 homolog, like n=1 Tax=Salarias fasciatus TaxID=181472 RepID=A0A672IM62_SALFA
MGTVHAKSLDPLPMHGRDLGMHPDDLLEAPEQAPESKQEILENKDVSPKQRFLSDARGAAEAAPPRIFKEVEVLIDTSEGRSGTPRPVWGVGGVHRD